MPHWLSFIRLPNFQTQSNRDLIKSNCKKKVKRKRREKDEEGRKDRPTTRRRPTTKATYLQKGWSCYHSGSKSLSSGPRGERTTIRNPDRERSRSLGWILNVGGYWVRENERLYRLHNQLVNSGYKVDPTQLAPQFFIWFQLEICFLILHLSWFFKFFFFWRWLERTHIEIGEKPRYISSLVSRFRYFLL